MLTFFYRLLTRYVLPIGVGCYAYSFYQRVQGGEDGFILFCHDLIQVWSYVEILLHKAQDNHKKIAAICHEFIYQFGGIHMQLEQNEEDGNKIEYIKNGKRIMQFTSDDDCDFVICSKRALGNKCVLKKLIQPPSSTQEQTQDTITEWKFLSLEIMSSVHGVSKSFKINLQTDDYNFYQVGNKLTPEFFHYYLQNVYSPAIEVETLHIDTLTIVDSNVTYTLDTFQPNERVEILLNKEDYTITKTKTS